MFMNQHVERTLVLLKPDTVQRNLIGEVISRFERAGLKIVALKFLNCTPEQALKHYVKNDAEYEALGNRSIAGMEKAGMDVAGVNAREKGESIINSLVKFLTASPVVALVLEGHQAVKLTRKLVGSTEPLNSDVGTIRGDYTLDSYVMADADNRAIRNLVHASGNVEEAEYEIPVWFKPEEVIDYRNVRDAILYDVNVDGTKE
jgi:nucleoside-diphosphate kinase